MRRSGRRFMGAVGALLILAAACGDGDGESTSTTGGGTSTTAESTTGSTVGTPTTGSTVGPTTTGGASSTAIPGSSAGVVVYMMMNETAGSKESGPFLAPVWTSTSLAVATPATPRDALVRLLTAPPTAPDRTTAIPSGTRLLGLGRQDRVNDGAVITVDLSKEFESGGGSLSMFSRLAQVVFTLTRFDGVGSVSFEIEGRHVSTFSGEGIELDDSIGRNFFEGPGLLPPVFVDDPAIGQTVIAPFHLRGRARDLFEATFNWELSRGGEDRVASGFVTTTGSQGWSDFDAVVGTALPGVDATTPLVLTAVINSAATGLPTWTRSYPIVVEPRSVAS